MLASLHSPQNPLKERQKKLEAIYQKKIEDLEELKKAILEKAFRGELVKGECVII